MVAFAFLTPFFFIKGGLNVSLAAVFSNLGLLAVLLAAKMAPKLAFIYPLARRADRRHGAFTTLLMSTGLTFGTISSLYGLNAGIIDKTQFSLLVTVVVISAVVPTAIAERWFLPDAERERRVDRRLAYAEVGGVRLMSPKRRDTPAHRAVAAIGWLLAAVGVVGLIVKPDLLILWVALIAFGVAPIPRALIERFRDRSRG